MPENNKTQRIATIINYCTNDYKFIKHCINEAKIFSEQIIIPVCDHFIDGSPENRDLLKKTYMENSDNALFIEYKYNQKIFNNLKKCAPHGFSRLIGYNKIDTNIDYILFIDTDEIVDGTKFKQFMERSIFDEYNAILFANYYYFRDTKFRADSLESSITFVKKSAIFNDKMFVLPNDRKGIYNSITGKKISHVLGIDGTPIAHHYSWVRTKEEMLRKVKTFGHSSDRDWASLVEKEFSHEFTGVDFVHNYKYKIVTPYIHLTSHEA